MTLELHYYKTELGAVIDLVYPSIYRNTGFPYRNTLFGVSLHPYLLPFINLYITWGSDCTTRTLHMPKPAKHSLKMRTRSYSSSFASSSLDHTVATSSGLILQICQIMAQSLLCKHCRLFLVSGQVSLAWRMVLRRQELYTWPRVF